MKKVILILILLILLINSVIAEETVVATEEQVVKMISNLQRACPSLSQKEIFDKLQDFSKNINPDVATFISAKEICQGHYLRYGNNVFLLDGKDISTICTETEITKIETQIGNLIYAGGDINNSTLNQNNFNFKLALEVSLTILGISLIGNLIQFVKNRRKKTPKEEKLPFDNKKNEEPKKEGSQ